jgi:peroxiredoxin
MKLRIYLFCLLVILAAAGWSVVSAARGQSNAAAATTARDGQTAPDFALKDASGKTVKLADYRGKVVLLDFWATWCTGCKEEIPWFIEFQQTYAARGFTAVGVSMDEGGWGVLTPFLASHKIPYPILLGDDRIEKSYAIEGMPDTFLIDRHGKIAATYRAKKVDKDACEAKIKALLAEK